MPLTNTSTELHFKIYNAQLYFLNQVFIFYKNKWIQLAKAIYNETVMLGNCNKIGNVFCQNTTF